ncbi:unnamed protein product [Caenorhabditis angaria]|uniref:Uncharacterized protein n=1 Tax=Caenorhabditis angaria TaxID=860376 RepID=A0A9P1IPT7_9PELO|nr:unnamed protein product [Caenorhabditis angaria]
MALSHFVRCFATFTNLIFLAISCSLLATTVLAFFSPPPQNVSPVDVGKLDHYIVTILLMGSYGIALFILSLVGLISLCFLNSFLLSVFIIGQVAMIGLLLVSFAFTLTVRHQVHYQLKQKWTGKAPCLDIENCVPIETFKRSETMLLVCLFGFLVLQILQLGACWYLCERRSSQEKYKLQLQKADEDDE